MKSILVIGLGRFGRHMVAKLLEEGNSVLAIEKSEERADNALDIISDVQIADATNEMVIRSLGVVAIEDNFQSALEITVLLKDFGAKYILARASRDVHRKLLLRNGADHVVYAERETAERLAIKYGSKNIFDYIELTPEMAICEVAVPSAWIGKSIVEKSVRTSYNISILATKKGEQVFPLPHPSHIFTNDETLIIMGDKSVIHSFTY